MLSIKSSTQIVNTKEQKAHISSVLIPLPDKKGSIFGLIRFLGASDETRELLAETINERLHRFKDTLEEGVHVARRFEQLLQALNEDIARIVSEHKKIPLSDAHIVIGVIYENKVFISGIGNLSTLFMHRTAQQRYVIYELSDQFKDSEEQSWDKLFVTVLDGELHPGDIFYLATRVSAREITLAELQDILTTLPASGSLKRIQQYLHRDTIYGGLCFQIADKKEIGPPKKENPMHSVERLDATHDKTASLLGDQAPDVGNFLTSITAPLIKKLSAPGTRGYKSLAKRMLKIVLQTLTIITAWIIKIIAFLIKYIIIGIQHLPGLVKRGRAVVKKQPPPKERMQAARDWFVRLPKITKYAGLGVSVLIIILVTSLSISGHRQAKQEQENTFTTIVTHIEEKMDASQASLIYDDEEQARLHLQEANALLATLDPANRSQEGLKEDLQTELQTVLFEIQKIEPIELEILAVEEAANFTTATQVNSTIYAIGSENTLYRLNALENSWQQIDTTRGAISTIQHVAATEDGNALVIDENQQLGRISLAANTMNPIISGANDLLSTDDLLEYNESLYILSAASDQIIKMRERGDGYEAGTPWITSTDADTSLDSARAIAIDGNIYILTDKTILSFLSGRQQTLGLDTVSPAMHNTIDLWTNTDSDYLYVLEPDESRIIVFDKEGALVAQYTNENLQDATTMLIDEENHAIIVVTPTTAYRFSPTHLLQ